jgi:hypothetical protein
MTSESDIVERLRALAADVPITWLIVTVTAAWFVVEPRTKDKRALLYGLFFLVWALAFTLWLRGR